jgi:hypothetical protein
MEAQLGALPSGEDKNTFVPQIKPLEKIKYTFFYLESEAKYATKDAQ